MLKMAPPRGAGAWAVPVVGTSAAANTGIDVLATTLARHRAWYGESAQRAERERVKAVARVRAVARELVIERMDDPALAREFDATIDALLSVTFRALRRARALRSLSEALDLEYRIMSHALSSHALAEGIRAQVIDKDRAPRWSPASLEDVTTAMVDRYFDPCPATRHGVGPGRALKVVTEEGVPALVDIVTAPRLGDQFPHMES